MVVPYKGGGVDYSQQSIPITELTFRQLQTMAPHKRAWIYPSRDVSRFIPLLSGPQQAALNFWGWVAIAVAVAGLASPLWAGSWWWLLLIPTGVVIWRANRRTMEGFFIENLQQDPDFFAAVRASDIGPYVMLVRAS